MREFLRAQLDNARTLHLQAGDILVFEEVLDPGTGRPENANPAHRHAVRLTKKPQFAYDLAARQALLEIEWDAEDKLPFSLCISAIIDTCEHKEDISIARGNAILVDHGETVEEALKQVSASTPVVTCDECGEVSYPVPDYYPSVSRRPLTFREEIQPTVSIHSLLQDRKPRNAVPQIKLSAVDELRIVEIFLDRLETKKDKGIKVKMIPIVLQALLTTLDKQENLSLAARTKAWELKGQLVSWLQENPHATMLSLLARCSEEVDRLRNVRFEEQEDLPGWRVMTSSPVGRTIRIL